MDTDFLGCCPSLNSSRTEGVGDLPIVSLCLRRSSPAKLQGLLCLLGDPGLQAVPSCPFPVLQTSHCLMLKLFHPKDQQEAPCGTTTAPQALVCQHCCLSAHRLPSIPNPYLQAVLPPRPGSGFLAVSLELSSSSALLTC